ncbi:alpha/beta hydrolase, partial [archaeon]
YDVPYLDAASEVEAARVPYKHRMDVYYPTSALAQDERTPTACPSGSDAPPPMPNRPVMVFVHGGGWKRFDRRSLYGMHGNVGRAFARRGFVVCVISYRLSRLLYTDLTWVYTALSLVIGCSTIGALGVEGTKNKLASSFAFLSPFLFGALYCFLSAVASKSLSSLWHAPVHHPTHVVDACTAIAYIARNVSKWGGDASRMSIMGHSAGGHIVSYLVSHPRYLRDAMRLPLDTPMRTIFHSAVCLSGVYSCEQLALTRQYTWRKPWLAPLIWLRRMSFLHPAFGTKAEAWPLGFPTTHCADTNTLAACQLPPILCINASFDLGLGAHTDEWQEQLLAAGVHTERCTFTPADHARYVMQMDTPGSASELIICDVIHDFLLRTVPAKSSTA